MRRQDWAERLDDFLRENAGKKFECGIFDCALFAADAVRVMTGDDFAAPFRGRYKTPRGAAAALKKYGGGDIEATVEKFLGPALTTPRKAQRGDVVLFESPEGPAIGIVDLCGTKFAAVTPEGLVRIPLKTALKAWRV